MLGIDNNYPVADRHPKKKKKQELYISFIDYNSAYNKVNRNVFESMDRKGCRNTFPKSLPRLMCSIRTIRNKQFRTSS